MNKKLVLVENNEILSNDAAVAKRFNQFFATITEPLDVSENTENIASTEGFSDPVLNAIKKYSNRSSIKNIKDVCQNAGFFSFRAVTRQEI